MKAFVLAILACVLITVGANLALKESGFSAQSVTTTGQSVRVGDDG